MQSRVRGVGLWLLAMGVAIGPWSSAQAQPQPRTSPAACAPLPEAPPVNGPRVQRLPDGTVVTTHTDSFGRTRTMREYPNGTSEIENRISQRRVILWPDGQTEEMPILVHARWSTDANGTRAESDSNGRLITTAYPDGSSVRFDYEANSSSTRVLGITVRRPESEGSPILW